MKRIFSWEQENSDLQRKDYFKRRLHFSQKEEITQILIFFGRLLSIPNFYHGKHLQSMRKAIHQFHKRRLFICTGIRKIQNLICESIFHQTEDKTRIPVMLAVGRHPNWYNLFIRFVQVSPNHTLPPIFLLRTNTFVIYSIITSMPN